ncbi:MAG: protein-ADP-ribose hydrolase [Clostridiales bacterium]|nr:protein-ADP-ribose hydrolase [Clostridiales bacterium]
MSSYDGKGIWCNMYDKIDLLLDKLKADSEEYKNLEIPQSIDEKKRIIRSLMNIRMPRSASEELLSLQDAYLKQELQDKGVVGIADIPTVKEQYGSVFHGADRISLWQGDITRLAIGAIVNAANSQMMGCFVPCHRCIDNAIHSAAGIQLREECSHIMNKRRIQYGGQYEEPVGTVTLTKGHNLPCEYVIHTVGPIVYGGLNDSLCQDLRNCYENVLMCCAENKIKSVAFCCISTGEFHFPNEKAAKIATDTVIHFLENDSAKCIERVIFNVFKDYDKEIYEEIFKSKS